MRRLEGCWPIAVLAGLLALTFGPAIAQGLLLAPNDGLAQYFPERVIAAASWRQGEVPFWNPYIFGGMPLLAAIQGGVLYPGNLAFLFLPPVAAMNLTVAAAYLVAGAGAYAFGRALAMPRPAALLTGTVYMLGGFMIAHLEHVVMVQAAGLLPWLLWAIERARAGSLRHAQAGALVLGLMLLAGHPQTAAFGMLLAAGYAIFRLVGVEPGRGAFARAMVLMGAIGVGLALAQLLPTLDLSRLSNRSALGYDALIDMSLPPRQLATLLFPFLFGGTPSLPFPTPYWGAGVWQNELVGYAGLGTLVLAACALGGDRRAPFFAAAALVGVVLALGGLTPLYRLWAALPLLNTMRVPGRHLLEVHMALSVLAGLGLSRLMATEASRRARLALGGWAAVALPVAAIALGTWLAVPALASRWQAFAPPGVDLAIALSPSQAALWLPLAITAAIGLGLAVLRRAGPALWAGAAIALVAGDLWFFAQHAGWRQHSPPLAEVPATQLDPHRTASLAAQAYPYRDLDLVRALGYPVAGSLWGVRAAGGYDPLMPARYAKLMGGISHAGHLATPSIWQGAHHAFDLLGVRHIALDAAIDEVPWAAGRFEHVADAGRVRVFENARAMPMAWRPAIVWTLTPPEVDAQVTSEPDFDPRTTVLLEAPLAAENVTPGLASAERASLNHITVATRGVGPGLVVVSEGYDPGWHAFLDGRALPVHRANGLLLGVEVPPGAHRFELRYEPRSWRAGLAGSGLALLGLVVWWGRTRRRGMSSSEGSPA